MEAWHVWVIISLLTIIIEIFTTGFAVFCISIGAIAGAITSYFTLEIEWQLLAMAIITMLSFAFIRPFVLKYIHKNSDENEMKTNTDALIGKTAFVDETIDNLNNKGRVIIDGDNWKAVSSNNQIIEKGNKVKIINRESVILTVK